MSGGMRIGDAERERAAAELGEHFALGRIDDDEHGERLDAVWSARTQADLDVLFADLPPLHPVQAPVASSRGGRGGWPPQRRERSGWRAVPFVPILVVLGVLTVLTYIPFVLIALVVGAVLWHKANRRRHRQYGDRSPYPAPHWR